LPCRPLISSSDMPKILRILNHIEELVLGFTLLGLAVFVFIQVVLRYGFHFAFSWAEELGRYLTIFMTFLGASLGVKYGTHFSMEALVHYLPERFRHLVKAAANLICGLFFVLVIFFAWSQIKDLHKYGASTATLRVPMYIPYIPIPLFSITIALRFFHLAYVNTRSFMRGST
jgi:C4-dicarboxylate transporter DctQ subunit